MLLYVILTLSTVMATSREELGHTLLNKFSSTGQLTSDETDAMLMRVRSCTNEHTTNGATMHNCSADDIFCKGLNECINGSTLESYLGRTMDLTGLLDVCPLLLYQSESGVCCRNFHVDHKQKPNQSEVWGYGILFVTLISLCSLVGVSVLPLMGKDFYHQLLTALVGLAVGSLGGSAAFHLIPQAFGLPEKDTSHAYLDQAAFMWAGVWVFFIVERALKITMDVKQRAQEATSSPKTPHHKLSNGTLPHTESCQQCLPPDSEVIFESQEQVIKASFGHQQKPRWSHGGHEHVARCSVSSSSPTTPPKDSPIAVVAWMIIFGDGLHNFIDGLSIGAAFNQSILTGVSISVAVMCEELPHELGDFAVLLNSGMRMRQALAYNFLSACTCYLGLMLGIVLGEINATSQYIFAFAGGMFLYISLVDMVPEMNEVVEEASKLSCKKALKVLFLQNIGLFIGVSVLYLLARYQDEIQF